jgi:cytochrome b
MREDTNVAIAVWDLPVRLFHWVLAVLFVAQVVTGKIGGALMTWHAGFGYTILALVIFRILWGFAGSVHARFASFVATPAAALRFASLLFSRRPSLYVGHNPLGGWSVIVMIVLLALQAIAGFFANDGAAFEGPLAHFVSLDASNRLAHLHRWNANVLLVLAAFHVAAVLFHWLAKKEDLIQAMFTGVKRVPRQLATAAPRQGAAGYSRAAALLAISISIVAVVVYCS